MLTRGTVLGGGFEVLGPLGAGGMGEVYRARDTRLGREVAIKVLPTELAQDADRLARFEIEARTASALNHPNIVTVHAIGREGATTYQVLELIEGRTLREVISSGPLPLRRALEVGEQIAAGLAAAHASGIVHRDLKPENVMLREDGLVKILDFGLAKLSWGDEQKLSELVTATRATSPGTILGTVGYMSPEQARGGVADFHSDQFSLATVLYEMLLGARPFSGETTVQTLAAIIEKEPEPLVRRLPATPPPVLWILDRCWAKDPRERYASTLDLARDLRNVREHLSEIASSIVPALGLAAPAARRPGARAATWITLGLVAGVSGASALLLWLGPRRIEPPTVRTLTFSGQDQQPAASPDGRTLAFASVRDGVPRIWLKSLRDGSEAPLTAGRDFRPRFSPDGTMVLFARDEAATSSLFRVPVLGGEPRKIVHDAGDGDWSPDGSEIVFLRQGMRGTTATTSIGVAKVDGGGERVLATLDEATTASPRWSPDGTRIAVSAGMFGLSESKGKFVFLVRADGSDSHRLYPPVAGGDVSGVSWIDGGREIVYAQGESVSTVALGSALVNAGASRVLRQNVDTGQARVLFWTPSLATVLDVVGPGQLVFDSLVGRQNLEEFALNGASAASGDVLMHGTSIDRQPIYTPDGEWIAFSSNRSGNLDLWARSRRTGEVRRLTDHPADDWDPAFSRDGKQLIWTSRRGGNFEIWMAEQDGTGARQVTHDGVDAENATATPDGRWLVYNSGDPRKSGIWKVRVDGTEATPLVPGTCAWPEVSPDGRHVAFTVPLGTGLAAIRVARVEDGVLEPFEISISSVEVANGRGRWMPDGRWIAFTWNTGGRPGVYAQEFRPGVDTLATRRELVGLVPGTLAESFGVSPDGTRIAMAASHRALALMSAENIAGLAR